MAMSASGRIVLIAAVAGVLGIAAGIAINGPGPLLAPALRTELGQRVLQRAFAVNAPPAPAGLVVAARGERMPPLVLPDLAGGNVALPEAYAGRTLLINFWASWCGPCIEEMPELDRYAAASRSNGAQVVGIALDRPEDVRAFLQHTPVAYPILIDVPGPRDSSVQLGNPKGVLPYTALIGADGRLLKQKIGPFAPGEIEQWVRP